MQPESKHHKLQTIQDLVDVVTRDNLDCLLGDLRNHLLMTMTARESGAFYIPRPGVINWIDSGRCDVFLSHPATCASNEPALQQFNDKVTHALKDLLTETLSDQSTIPVVVHPHKFEAHCSSEED